MECSICTEACPKPISCPYCPTNNIICKKCVCANIINNVAVPTCIFCKTAWTTSDIVSKLGYKFFNNEIRDAETQLLLSREDNTINKAFASADQSKVLGMTIKQINQRIKDAKAELKNLQKQKMQLKNKLVSLNVANFTHPCPIIGCKGFIHNTDKYCNTCESTVCSKCLEVLVSSNKNVDKSDKGAEKKNSDKLTKNNSTSSKKLVETQPTTNNKGKEKESIRNEKVHTCSEANLTTVHLLEDSKKCPNCDVKIHKISGCSQMFCTMCYTAFDWTTLKIIKGNIHNPHYFEVANNMVTCKNIVSIKLSSLIHPLISYDENLSNNINGMHQVLTHIQPIIDSLRIKCDNHKIIDDVRHKYGSGDIDRETFGDKLYIAERKRNINVLLIQSLEILNDVVIACLNKLSTNLDRCISILSVKGIDNINVAKRALNNDDREVINDYKKKIKEVVKKSHNVIIDVYNKLKEEYDARGLNIPRKSDLFLVYLERGCVV